ncbi:MAG TPA: MGMT family protein [Bryobacteraceae bacterium]|nr:MGMT family protein [Bryobacteraceae bacterium]
MFERVLAVVRKIPKGKVATYGDVAAAAGFPGAARQVVWALRSGGKAVPWHRVLGAKGRVLLPGPNGLEQRLRLRTEGVVIAGDRVDLDLYGHRFKTGQGAGTIARAAGESARATRLKSKLGKS